MTTLQPSWRSRIVEHGEANPADLIPNPRNWRIHSRRQQLAVEEMLDRIGWVQDVVVNRRTGHLVDGHMRVAVASRRGETAIPVVYIDVTEDEEKLILAALDPVGDMATTDAEMLGGLLEELDLGSGSLATMFGTLVPGGRAVAATADPNDAPEAPEAGDLYVNAGDLWQLGRHRMVVGDATKVADVRRVLGGVNAQMAFTDPPYNVDYGNHSGASARGRTTRQKIMNDSMDDAAWALFIRGWSLNLVQHVDGAIYCCMSTKEWAHVDQALRLASGHWSDTIIWAKDSFTLGRADYQRAYEPIWYGWREGVERHWSGSRKESNVWELDVERGVVARDDPGGGMRLDFGLGLETVSVVFPQRLEGRVFESSGTVSDLWRIGRGNKRVYVHPTQKPVELVERALLNSSMEGDAILDPFLGSGTTLIAAEATDRRCFGLELDPRYAQVVLERWKQFTGVEPQRLEGLELAATGRTSRRRGTRAGREAS